MKSAVIYRRHAKRRKAHAVRAIRPTCRDVDNQGAGLPPAQSGRSVLFTLIADDTGCKKWSMPQWGVGREERHLRRYLLLP